MHRQNCTRTTAVRNKRSTGLRFSALTILLVTFFSLSSSLLPLLDLRIMPVPRAEAAGVLSVQILAGYNLVVDSNASSPSTYAPSAATVAGRFCNTGDALLTNVVGKIGNYTANTPGVYPSRDSSTFGGTHPLYTTGLYYFTHVGGTLGAADATRFIGTLAPGECKVQYWHFTYPQCRNVLNSGSWVWKNPPCDGGSIPVWGDSVKPDDDLWLNLDIWGTSSEGPSANATRKMTMRNEISAMANKIKPNPDGAWFNTKANIIEPGGLITSNGILYEIGVINQGFDNDGNGTPDYNAWLQPIGDASYDPGCFRLVRTTGVFTISRSGGNPDMIIPFSDAYPSDPLYVGGLYFTNLPPDNTGTRGLVYYTFQALTGPCSTALSPYQEVASGRDNEKFNGDYGTAIPPIGSTVPKVTLNKSSNPSVIPLGSTTTYQMPFANTGTSAAGMGLSTGGTMPLVISDTVPTGMQYVGGSAIYNLTYSPNTGVTRRYSVNSGSSWSTTDPGTVLSTWPYNKVIIQWWLNDPLPAGNTGSYAQFQATVPSDYIGVPFIENCANAQFDTGLPFARACTTVMIQGTGQIGNRVWKDENRNAVQDAAETTQINNVALYLYWDKNGNGLLDSTDVLVRTQDSGSTTDPDESNSNYNFTGLPNGNYLVKVNKLDPDIDTVAQGYTLSTAEVFAVTLSAGSNNYNNADFGFAPTLRLDKHLLSPDPAYVGETVTYQIELRNELPGDGTANGYCGYTIWASVQPPADSIPASGSGNSAWQNIPAGLLGAPDGSYAYTNLSDNNDDVGISGFNLSGQSGTITSVRLVAYAKEIKDLQNSASEYLRLVVYRNNAIHQTLADYSGAGYFAAGPGGTLYVIDATLTAPTGGWQWSDFQNNVTELRALGSGTGSPADRGDIGLDAVAFVVTTDQTTCGGADRTLNPLPLTDTYNATYLQFLYADPPASSQSAGTITWDNLGPLYAGGTRVVTVYFKALATVASPGTTNTGSVTTAKFASGRNANSATDNATVVINSSFSLSGKTWIDGGTIGWSGTTGYQTPFPGVDNPLPNVKMDLYVCVGGNGLPIAYDNNRSNACGAKVGEYWKPVGTKYTDYNGDYTFDGLRPGYYNVRANGTALPTGMTTQTAEATGAANGSGGNGGNGEWNDQSLDVKGLAYLSANTTQVNFGYRNPTLGTVTGYVWHDQDRGGYNDWDAGEPPIPGATVTLWLCNPDPTCSQVSSTTTDSNGYYQFSGVTPTSGNQSYRVRVTPPSGMGQTADPNYSAGSCYGNPTNCDNQTNTFTLAADGVHGPDKFGYYGGLRVGDTVYVDWNGDGSQNTTAEEGIGGVKVYLYQDSNGNGVLDSGEPLLATRDTLYNVIGGKLDIDNDGSITGSDDKTLLNGYRIIDGQVDINNDGFITGADNGSFAGYSVYAGLIDTSDNGSGGSEDNANLLGKYEFTNVAGNNNKYVVVVNTSSLPAGLTQTGDPDEQPGTCSICDSKDPLTLGSSDYLDADFGYQPRGFSSIGDYVWLDADGDGVQDTNESGISGVTVNLYQDQDGDGVIDTEDALMASTATGFGVIDGYIDINRNGSYDAGDDSPALLGVRVIDGKLDIDGNGVVNTSDDGTFAGYPVIDGLLDINRSGTITTADDGTLAGLYQFRNLAAGNYIIDIPSTNFNSGQPLNGLTQSYDQDSTTVLDNQDQVTLGNSENYVLGDFGYTSSAIGDTVWQDNNGNGLQDAGEPGIQNVAVELYQDLDNDGDVTDPGETTPIRTTTTDASGHYYFTGLPGGDYIVEIAASNFGSGQPLYQFTQTYDPDASTQPCSGGQCDNQGMLVDTTAAYGLPLGQVDYSRDFGYQPRGRIGDTLWIDNDSDGVRDANESGIANVTVYLCTVSNCNSGNAIQNVSTDSNGYYTFGNLPDNTYYVAVDRTDPDFPSGLNQTYDPDGTLDDKGSNIVMSGGVVTSIGGNSCSSCDMNVDSGYRFGTGSNSLSGTVYHDNNNNGTLDPGTETQRYANVNVYLWQNGLLVGTTTSDANGSYSFSNLPNGTYTVSVDSTDPDLNGAVPTATSSPTTSYTRTLSGGTSSTDNNFGFLFSYDFGDLPSSYGNTVLSGNGARHFVPLVLSQRTFLGRNPSTDIDTEPNGQESANADGDGADEHGITRTVGVNWAPGANGGSIDVRVSGCPNICYLTGWIDWGRDNGLNQTGDRVLTARAVQNGLQTLTFPIPAGTSFNNVSYYARFRLYTSNSPAVFSAVGEANNGEVEDYLWGWGPTAVKLLSFTAAPRGISILVAWETASEDGNVGFNLYRREAGTDTYARINGALIPSLAPGQGQGASYTWVDSGVEAGKAYEYLLEDVDISGTRTQHGPVMARTPVVVIFFPTIGK